MPHASTPDDPSTAPNEQANINTTQRQTPVPADKTKVNAAPPSECGDKPKLPHERDQSVDMTHGEPDAQIEQAYRDVKRGLQDTDRGPPADKAYQKQK